MKLANLLLLCSQVSALTLQKRTPHHGEHYAPVVKTCNGTYTGVHSSEYEQDYFLGVPFAQPPVGDLRFRNPKSLDSSWEEPRDATKYSPTCVGYGPSQMGYEVSEDCLYLNVIRPSGIDTSKYDGLPVAVWIHGGGFVQGSGVDLRYNLSFIVQESVASGTPMIGITLNYRLGAWGFLQGYEASTNSDDGSNYGIRDQRLALHWIRENIAAFGGDPDKVTIWGQSAGAASVGLHITAYNGRDDKLFRSAIMESGAPVFLSNMNRTSYYQTAYRNLTSTAGCNTTSSESLACLRSLPYSDLNSILNTTAFSGIWNPQIDSDIIADFSSTQLSTGSFVPVPIIIGANTDEGTSFSPTGINTTSGFRHAIQSSDPLMNTTFTTALLSAYPSADPSNQILANLPANYTFPPDLGPQYRRAATYYGDSRMIANRRSTCETWASNNLTAYCYRFNAIPAWATPLDGSTHFVEVAFAMLTLSGVGYPPVRTPPFAGKPESYTQLARLMSRDWINFVATGGVGYADRSVGDVAVPGWPVYDTQYKREFVYDANVTSFVEEDRYREEGIRLIIEGARDVYGK